MVNTKETFCVSPVTRPFLRCSNYNSIDRSMLAPNHSLALPVEKISRMKKHWTSTSWWSTRNLKKSSAENVQAGFSRMRQPSKSIWQVIKGPRRERLDKNIVVNFPRFQGHQKFSSICKQSVYFLPDWINSNILYNVLGFDLHIRKCNCSLIKDIRLFGWLNVYRVSKKSS